MKEEFRVLPVEMSDGMAEAPEQIQVLPFGSWEHAQYGEIEIGGGAIEAFMENFDRGIRRDIPITEGHSNGGKELPAIGWFKELINKGRDGLWAVVEWTDKGKELLADRAYKYFSPEFYTDYEDPETHEHYKNVLVGGALTNNPYFKGMKAVVFSELKFSNMDIKELIKKDPEELTDEEVTFLEENAEELSDDEKERLLPSDEEVEEEEEEVEEVEEKEEEKVEGSDKVVMDRKALKVLSEKAERGVKAMKKIEMMEAKEAVDNWVFSEDNSQGRILPKSRDSVVDFYLSLSEAQQDSFSEIMGDLPEGKLFSEMGSGEEADSGDKLDSLVEKRMENKKLEYSEALNEVLIENPELAE